jgi:RNA polymerase primary sigma factor
MTTYTKDSFGRLMAEAKDLAPLPPHEQIELARRAKAGDAAAGKKLCAHSIRMLISSAKSYVGYGLDLTELVNEGAVGLMTAIQRFNPDRGLYFTTYAVHWIRQAMIRALQDKGRLIRIPSNVGDAILKEKRTGKLDEKKYSRERVDAAKNACGIVNINCKNDNGNEIAESLFTGDEESPEREYEKKERKMIVSVLMGKLPERAKYIIRHRYGLDGGSPKVLQELSDELGISREWVNKIEHNALGRLSALHHKLTTSV